MTSGLRTLIIIGFGAGGALAVAILAFFQFAQVTQQDTLLEIVTVSLDAGNMGCSEGRCETRIVVRKDASFLHEDAMENQVAGIVSVPVFTPLRTEIENTDIAAIQTNKRQRACAALSEEVRITYTFYHTETPRVLASCEVRIPYRSALFQSISNVQQEIARKALERRQ